MKSLLITACIVVLCSAQAPSRFDNRGVSLNDNMLSFWRNNSLVAKIKITFSIDYSGTAMRWLDKQINNDGLKIEIDALQYRINNQFADYLPLTQPTLRLVDPAGTNVFVTHTNSAWALAAQRANKSLTAWAEDTLDNAATNAMILRQGRIIDVQ